MRDDATALRLSILRKDLSRCARQFDRTTAVSERHVTVPNYPQRAASERVYAARVALAGGAIPSRAPSHVTSTMSFAVSASATRAVASARAPVKAQRASAAAAFAPAAKASTAARLSLKPRANGAAALKATGSVATKAARGSVRVLAGRFETERTYIMIKPDGVQRGYVRLPPVPIARDADSDRFSFLSRHPPRRPTRPAE